jgi:hypothetical protein
MPAARAVYRGRTWKCRPSPTSCWRCGAGSRGRSVLLHSHFVVRRSLLRLSERRAPLRAVSTKALTDQGRRSRRSCARSQLGHLDLVQIGSRWHLVHHPAPRRASDRSQSTPDSYGRLAEHPPMPALLPLSPLRPLLRTLLVIVSLLAPHFLIRATLGNPRSDRIDGNGKSLLANCPDANGA